MAENANTPAHDSGKLKTLEPQAEPVDPSAYFAELDAIDRETVRLNRARAREAEWDKWEKWTSRIWREIYALPATPENSSLKARAIWSLTEGDLSSFLLEGDSLCTRMAAQVFQAFSKGDGDERWSAARQSLEAAQAAEVGFDDRILRPAFVRAEKGGPSIPQEVSDESTRLTDVRCDAEEALIAMPAPDLSAAIWKIEYARNRWEAEEWPDDWWNAVMSDLNRLAAGENA